MEGEAEKRDVRRPMNAFLIFCKRHRTMVREKNPDLDNRSVTRILGDLWANLKEEEKSVYTDLAKQYKDAFMKANPDYKWHNPDKAPPSQKMLSTKPGNLKVLRAEMDLLPEGSIMPGKLADPSNMGGLSLLLMAGQENVGGKLDSNHFKVPESREPVMGNRLADRISSQEKTESETEIAANQKSVEDAINRTICETALHCPAISTVQSLQEIQGRVINASEQNAQSLKETSCSTDTDAQKWNIQSDVGGESKSSFNNIVAGFPTNNSVDQTLEMATNSDGVNVSSVPNTNPKTPANTNLLELAEMCSTALGDKKSSAPQVHNLKKGVKNGDNCKSETKLPGTSGYKGMLAEALLDTCHKGNYTGLLKWGNYGVKGNIEIPAVSDTSWLDTAEPSEVSGGNITKQNVKSDCEGHSSVLKTSVREKSEISHILVADIKKEEKKEEEESAMVTCGKMVVNHIIDKLYFSDLATAARKAAGDKQSKAEGHAEIHQPLEKQLTLLKSGEIKYSLGNAVKTSTDMIMVTENKQNYSDSCKGAISCKNFDEPDGVQDQGQTKVMSALNKADKYVSRSLKDKILSRVMKEQSLEMLENKDSKDVPEESVTANIKKSTAESKESESKTETKMSVNLHNSETQIVKRKRTVSQNSNTSSVEDAEGDDREEYQPVRKSKRRNRGQRYQELINEGIIQPSKERMAAIMHDSKNNSGEVEDFQSIDSHILPETAIRRIRKRTISESDKGKVLSPEEAKRYKTGDFDLEAHIATLPACCIENLSRKRGFARQRHLSDTCPNRKPEESDEPAVVIDLEKTVSLPPHIKIPTPERNKEPVTGSRKRKARKHSITHLLPAPSQSVVTNNKTKFPKSPETGNSSSQKCDQDCVQQHSPGESTWQQNLSTGLDQKCKKCAKTENHSTEFGEKHNLCSSLGEKSSEEDSGSNVYTKDELKCGTDLNISKTSDCFDKERDRCSTTSSFTGEVLGHGDMNKVTLEGLVEKNDGQNKFQSANKHEMLIQDSAIEAQSSKHLDDTDQCKSEDQSVLGTGDQERDLNENQSTIVKANDCLKEGGILYSDDLIIEKTNAYTTSEGSGQVDNVHSHVRGRLLGKKDVQTHSSEETSIPCREAYLQNKENVIRTESKRPCQDCDMSLKVDLVHTDKHWSGDMVRRTLDHGQMTTDSVNLFVVSESCDKLTTSAINVEAKDMNFNSKVQSH